MGDSSDRPGELTIDIQHGQTAFKANGNLRGIAEDYTERVVLVMKTQYPAEADRKREYSLLLPKDCDLDDCLVISSDPGIELEIRMSDLSPDISVAARLRLRMFAEACISSEARKLLESARHKASITLGPANP